MDSHDDLIARIRSRAADPERRTEGRESAFVAGVRSMDLGALVSQVASLGADMARLMADPLQPPPDVVARAMDLGAAMERPAERPLPAPCPLEELDRAEASLGFPLPPLLRRLLTEVADGGFGPGYGIVGIAGWDESGSHLVELYHDFRDDGDGAPADGWPAGLLPLVHTGCGSYDCVDTAAPGAPVVTVDLGDMDDEDLLADAIVPVAPTIEAWFEEWLVAPTTAERAEQATADMAASIWAQQPETELDRMTREWMREQGYDPPG